jgi:putative ABC transport system ATP-binding protein
MQRSHEIMALLVALNRDHGITVLMVTHEEDMAAYAHRQVHFLDGSVARDVLNAHPATAAPAAAAKPGAP